MMRRSMYSMTSVAWSSLQPAASMKSLNATLVNAIEAGCVNPRNTAASKTGGLQTCLRTGFSQSPEA